MPTNENTRPLGRLTGAQVQELRDVATTGQLSDTLVAMVEQEAAIRDLLADLFPETGFAWMEHISTGQLEAIIDAFTARQSSIDQRPTPRLAGDLLDAATREMASREIPF